MAPLAPARIGALAVTSLLLAGALSSCATTARITDVYMALDGQGDRKRNVFFTDTKEIHCVIEMGIGRKGVTVEGLVRAIQDYDFQADKFFDTNRVLANAEGSPSPAEGVQKFDVSLKPADEKGMIVDGAPFPPGRFVCEATLDGVLEKVTVFNVDFPPCPTSFIVPASVCIGFYKSNTVCPRLGASAVGSPLCHCDAITGWQCDG
ncbi:MAG: hypothetical protein JWO86_5788 [Myxococcaceae bacterium]|jgi:hypothetical protein|nr:hypothetical protein [Myxococcaceae bacterium]